MTIWKHNSTKETGWGHCEEPEPHTPHVMYLLFPNMHLRILIIQSPKKRIKPMHASLFGLLPPDIIADIYIWISRRELHNKFKHIILLFKFISNPGLF